MIGFMWSMSELPNMIRCQKYGTFKELRLKKQRSVVILGKMTLPYSTSLYSNSLYGGLFYIAY